MDITMVLHSTCGHPLSLSITRAQTLFTVSYRRPWMHVEQVSESILKSLYRLSQFKNQTAASLLETKGWWSSCDVHRFVLVESGMLGKGVWFARPRRDPLAKEQTAGVALLSLRRFAWEAYSNSTSKQFIQHREIEGNMLSPETPNGTTNMTLASWSMKKKIRTNFASRIWRNRLPSGSWWLMKHMIQKFDSTKCYCVWTCVRSNDRYLWTWTLICALLVLFSFI